MALPPHIIRLRLPWELTFTAVPAPGGPPAGSCTMRRRFRAPTGLLAADRVILVLDGPLADGRVTLNGQTWARQPDERSLGRYEIGRQLQPVNELTIELPVGLDAPEVRLRKWLEHDILSVGSVRLEIVTGAVTGT